jgi:hypothetical protein
LRANRDIPCDLEGEGKHLKKWKSAFGRNGDVMVRVWNKTCAIGATIVNKGRKDGKTNMEIKKIYAVVQYNKFIKALDRADKYLSFYAVLRKTVKWSTKVVLHLPNCVLLYTYFVYRTLNKNKNVKYKNFLRGVGPGYQKSRIEVSTILMTFNCLTIKQHQRGLHRTRQADSPFISEYTNL